MAARKDKSRQRGDSHEKCEASGRLVLVGTCKGDQLAKWRGWYNYPISDDDKIGAEDASKTTGLWLFNGTKNERRYKASFVGVKTRKELIEDYGYPAKGKAHGDKYLLFKTDFKYQHKGDISEDAERVILRTADFVCEAAVQMKLFAWNDLQPVHMPRRNGFTAMEPFAGAGGLSIGLERAGIHVVIANEIMPDFAATLAANHPDTNVINDDIHKITFKEELKKLGLESIDVLSGGPHCQGFSTIGSKNRQDPRNSLFYEYLRAVAETNPKYTVFENVSGFKRMLEAA